MAGIRRTQKGTGCNLREPGITTRLVTKRSQLYGQTRQASVQTMKTSIKRFLKQFRVIRRAVVHPLVPWHAKVVAGCALLYIVSPIQLIPNFIPIIGQMDDVVIVILALKYLRRHVPKSVLDDCENDSGASTGATVLVTPGPDPLPDPKS
jgi:uncharacterized membrane protein YkvA (DUF1232 family)